MSPTQQTALPKLAKQITVERKIEDTITGTRHRGATVGSQKTNVGASFAQEQDLRKFKLAPLAPNILRIRTDCTGPDSYATYPTATLP